jgi:outer membrane lipoprotein carrier protein
MALSGLLVCLAISATNPDSLWLRLKAHYLTLKSLSGDFAETMRPEYETTGPRFSGSFSAVLPDRYRIEVKNPQRQVIVGDNSALWFYFPSEKRAVRQSGGSSMPLLAFLDPMLDSASTASVLEDSTGVLRLKVSSPDSGLSFSDFTFRLDPASLRITAFSFADAWGNAYDFELSRQQWNPKIPGRTFLFSPPKGTTVDSLGP